MRVLFIFLWVSIACLACDDAAFKASGTTEGQGSSDQGPVQSPPPGTKTFSEIRTDNVGIGTNEGDNDDDGSISGGGGTQQLICPDTRLADAGALNVRLRYEPFSNQGNSPDNRSPDVKANWLEVSNVYTIDLMETGVERLPEATYDMDDILMVIPANKNVTQTGGAALYQTVTFAVPSDAFVLKMDGQTGGQIGFLTPAPAVRNTKVYNIEGGPSVTVPVNTPGGVKQYVTSYTALPLKTFNQISMTDWQAGGYIQGNTLSFKVVHVTHGIGHANFSLQKYECDE